MSEAMMTKPAVVARMGERRAARRWPRNPYVQALVTYPRRWVIRLAGLWLLFWVGIAGIVLYNQGNVYFEQRERVSHQFDGRSQAEIDRSEASAVVATGGAVLAVMLLPGVVAIASYVRERTGDWRGTLMPGYRAAHLWVGAGLMLANALVVWVLMSVQVSPYSAAGYLGMVLGIAAIGAACAALPPRGIATVGIGSVVVFSFRGVREWVSYGLTGIEPVVNVVTIGAALAGLMGLWVWMATTRGERRANTAEDLMIGAGWAAWRRRSGEDVTTMSSLRRVRLWRVWSSSGLMPAACGAGLLVLIVSLVVTQADDRRGFGPGIAIPLAALSTIVPGVAVAAQWARRVGGLGYEMSRPVVRPAFVRELGLAMACDWASWWGSMTLGALLAIIYVVYFGPLGTGRAEGPGVIPAIAWGVGLSAAAQVPLLAAVMWVARFQSRWGVYFTGLTGAIVAWTPVVYVFALRSAKGDAAAGTVVVAIVTAGVGVMVDAYRRTVRADLR